MNGAYFLYYPKHRFVCIENSNQALSDFETFVVLQIVDLANFTETGQIHRYCITARGGPLKVTLVWHDLPASMLAKTALVNDLDLTVLSAALGGQPLFSQSLPNPDRVNNVESVRFQSFPKGITSISVAAFYLQAGTSQAYALVVQGDFDGVLQSPSNPAAVKGARGSYLVLNDIQHVMPLKLILH